MKRINLISKKFGRLTVLYKVGVKKNRDAQWFCACECGKTIVASQSNLIRAKTKSCGCLRDEMTRARTMTHGKSKTRLYNTWTHMRQRCEKPRCHDYPDYGGRGISVCSEWTNSFEAFWDWAIDHGYDNNLSLDRIDVDGNYEPSNCRWATIATQNNNLRRNRKLTYNGVTRTMSEWAKHLGISYTTLKSRIVREHWAPDRALTEPVHKQSARQLATNKDERTSKSICSDYSKQKGNVNSD